MGELTIITNNVPRDVVEAYELSAKEREEFDYVDWPAIEKGEASATFFRYKGELYDLSEFDRCSDNRFEGWTGIQSDSFFSGIVVRYVEDFERVVIGRYYS